jgi:hypothetical protein
VPRLRPLREDAGGGCAVKAAGDVREALHLCAVAAICSSPPEVQRDDGHQERRPLLNGYAADMGEEGGGSGHARIELLRVRELRRRGARHGGALTAPVPPAKRCCDTPLS